MPSPVCCSANSLHSSEADAETEISDLTFLTPNQSSFPDEGHLQEHSRAQCAPQFISVALCKAGAARLSPGSGAAHTSRKGSTPGNVEGCTLTERMPQECPVVQTYTNVHHTTAVGMVPTCPEVRSPSCDHWGGTGDTLGLHSLGAGETSTVSGM